MSEKDWKGIHRNLGENKVVYICQCESPDCDLEIELSPGERGEIISRNISFPSDNVYLIHPNCEWGMNEIKIGLYDMGEENDRFVVQKPRRDN